MKRLEAVLRRWDRRPDEVAIAVLIAATWAIAAVAFGVVLAFVA